MKNMKKILSLLLVFAMTFGCMSGMALAATGTKPADGVTKEQPFAAGTGGSAQFRIPCLVTLDDGTLVAGCDARWTTYLDGGGLDTIVSYSKDNGATWNYTFANYLGDNGNVHNYGSTAFIDPAMATDGENVWLIADLYPAAIGLNGATYAPQTGHTGYDANGNLVLAAATASVGGGSSASSRAAANFQYHLEKIEGAKADAESYYQLKDASGNNVDGYAIDAYFNIKGAGVDTNLFIADSPYFPYPTDFLYMTKSEDGGATWSVPTLIDVKKASEQTLLVGPGRGLVTSEGRIIFTAYEFTSGDRNSCCFYSDDNGLTWERGASVSSQSSEATVVEANEKLYMFTRHGGYYVSEDWAETWSPRKEVGYSYATDTQLSAITYSEKIDGKTAILLSAPCGSARRTNGKILMALVDEQTGALEWKHELEVCGPGEKYAYSCLTELQNGDIGLLWEWQDSGIRFDTFTMDEILGRVKNITIDPEEQFVDENDEATSVPEITTKPDESVATVTSEFEVKDAVIKLRDHTADVNSSLSSFAAENGSKDLEECEFTFTANGDYWQISNGTKYIQLAQAKEYFGTATDLIVEKSEGNTFRIALPKGDGVNPRYAVFYTQKMVFDAWATSDVSSVTNTAVKFDLVLLEKQDEISQADVIPGYTRATEVKDGGVYLISYIWGADTEDKSDNGLIVLYPTNGQTAQTKLVGGIETSAKSKVTITGVAPGKTTAVVGDVTYNITVDDPAKRPDYAGNDLPTEGMQLTAGSLEPSEGSLEALLDGDPNSFYHSNWSGTRPTAADFWITIELPEVTAVSGMRYLPRQSSANGRILSYEISYSLDGETWTTAASGDWADDANWKVAKFDENVEAKYVKIFAVDSKADNSGRHMTAAELRVVKATEEIIPPVEEEEEVVRLYGSGRYETGYAVADALKEALGADKFEAVVVATGKNFADALAGSYLAVEKNAPILLTNGNDDNVAALHAYIAANVEEGGKVYILGGTGAVPASVEAIAGYDVVRLSGPSRYDTNLEILKEAGVAGDSIIVATGKTFADSLSASAAKLPILLVKPNATLNDAQKSVLADMKNIYIVGGEGAVSADYEAELKAFGTVTRVSGKSRYETSVEIAKTFCGDVNFAVVASGKNFPDGLCGGPLAAALDAPLVLTKDGGAEAASSYVAEKAIASGYVLGGSGALADATVVEVFALSSADEIK